MSLQKISMTIQGELNLPEATSKLINKRFQKFESNSFENDVNIVGLNKINAQKLFSLETQNIILELIKSDLESPASRLILKNWQSWIALND